MVSWAQVFSEEIAQYSTSGVAPNFLSLEGDERVKAAYGANYDRSVELENEYDPANLFRMNQNIEPSV